MQIINKLAIGILTWKAPKTLENTLRSYKKNGLLDFADEKIIFIQENGKEERKLAKKYGLTILSDEENIGITNAYIKLLEASSSEYFLFLENDWKCVEPKEIVQKRLTVAIDLLETGRADCVKLRHKYKYGEPLCSLQFKGDELNHSQHLLDSVHWIGNPAEKFPELIKKIKIGNENWFLTTPQYANYTNNPCVYKKTFIKKILTTDYGDNLTEEQKTSAINYSKAKGVNVELIELEGKIENWWKTQNFKIVQGIGLFEHFLCVETVKKPSKFKKRLNRLKMLFFKNKNKTKQIAFICAHRDSDAWSTPISVMKEFESLGWDVKIYSLFDENDNYIEDKIRDLYSEIRNGQYYPDIIMHMDFSGFKSKYLSKLNHYGIFTVFEAGDDPRQYKYNLPKIKDFKLVLSPDFESTKKYKRRFANAIWWTHFADTRVQYPLDYVQAKPVAISTRGQGNSYFMDKLEELIPEKFINKNGFSGKEYSEFMSSGTIILQNSRDKEITRRLFEGMAIKRMVLTDRLPEKMHINDLFVENEDIVYYDNLEDCINKINYYTSEEGQAECEKIANKGYEKVIKNHTQKQRVQTILDEYGKWIK